VRDMKRVKITIEGWAHKSDLPVECNDGGTYIYPENDDIDSEHIAYVEAYGVDKEHLSVEEFQDPIKLLTGHLYVYTYGQDEDRAIVRVTNGYLIRDSGDGAYYWYATLPKDTNPNDHSLWEDVTDEGPYS
jgi:hypothetical protein